jgi:poly(A) polymerase
MADSVVLLRNVPAARLFDEFLKMFQAGFAEKTFLLLREYGLFRQLFPETDQALDADEAFRRFVRAALVNTDKRVAEEKSVTPMFLIAVFLWAPIREHAQRLRDDEGLSEVQSLTAAAWDISGLQQSRISIPKRFTAPMREMLALQPRFDKRSGRRALNFLEHRRFRAAYDFMVLRAETGEIDESVAHFWTDVQNQPVQERDNSFALGDGAEPRKKRRRRRGRGRSADAPTS